MARGEKPGKTGKPEEGEKPGKRKRDKQKKAETPRKETTSGAAWVAISMEELEREAVQAEREGIFRMSTNNPVPVPSAPAKTGDETYDESTASEFSEDDYDEEEDFDSEFESDEESEEDSKVKNKGKVKNTVPSTYPQGEGDRSFASSGYSWVEGEDTVSAAIGMGAKPPVTPAAKNQGGSGKKRPPKQRGAAPDNIYTQFAAVIEQETEIMDQYERGKGKKQKAFRYAAENISIRILQPAIDDLRQAGKNQYELEAARYMQDMMYSLFALSRNKAKYTKEYLKGKLDKLDKIMIKSGADANSRAILRTALEDFMETNLHKQSSKSSSFDRSKESSRFYSDTKKPHVIIEHKDSGRIVSATFSYGRNVLFDKKSENQAISDQHEKMLVQMTDFVGVAIAEYGKGTSEENPIKIFFKGVKQPEAALALLIEYKKRAVQEGRTFYARNAAGEIVSITSDKNLSAAEIAYFREFADQKPEVKKDKKAKHCAGYYLLEGARKGATEEAKDGMNVAAPSAPASGKELSDTNMQELVNYEISRTQALSRQSFEALASRDQRIASQGSRLTPGHGQSS